jgi:hypothetical protein
MGFGNDLQTDAADFSDITNPFFDMRASSIFLYPMATAPQVAAGAQMRVEFTREPSEFVSTDTAKTLGIDAPFQPMVPIGASYEWCSINSPGQAMQLLPMVEDYERRLREYVPMKDQDMVSFLSPIQQDYT